MRCDRFLTRLELIDHGGKRSKVQRRNTKSELGAIATSRVLNLRKVCTGGSRMVETHRLSIWLVAIAPSSDFV